jgi:Chitobiase/beta-hexosaminidase C-terminal domain
VTGFAPNEGISYKLDGAAITGSPSSVGANGSATISSLTIPAGTGDGPHTIAAVGNDPGAPSNAEASILVDTTPPAISPFITPPPNAAGWNNTSPVEVNATVDDGNGSGLAYAKYTDDGTDPKTSPSSQFATAPLSIGATTTLKYFVADLAGNQSAVETLPVKIDTTPPYFTVALVDVQGGVYTGPPGPQGQPGTNYYRGADAGSLRFKVTPVPTGGSAAVSAGFTPLSADTSGFSFDSSSVTTPVGGPFVSNPFSWVAGTTSTPSGTITLLDAADNTFGDSGSLYNDSTAPSGGSVDASGLSGTGGRYSTSLALNLNLAKGSDTGTGLADGSAPTDTPSQLQRASASLTSSGTANGSCGTYGAYAQVAADNPSSTLADTVPTDATCYRYRYLVPDHIGNVATYTSPDIKVMTTTLASVRPTDATITPVSGTSAQSVSASTVFYNPALSGGFNVDSSASASVAGIAQMTFPALAGFTGGGAVTTPNSGTTYRMAYAWSGNGSSPSPGVQALSATNNAGNSRSNDTAFSVVKDDVAPGGGSVAATGLGGTGGRYSTSTTLSLALAPGVDTGSGLATTGRKLLRASASLTSDGTSDGSCGIFGAYTQVGADDPATPKSDTVPVDRLCYRYHYVVPDKVGNQATYTSPDIKVDAAAPPTPSLTFSGLSNASWSGTGTAVFYRPAATSGGFTVNASSADATSGTTGYGFPTLPAGWSGSSGGSGIQNYSWSAPNPGVPSGGQVVTTTNNAGGQSSNSFTASVTSDATAPSGGTVSYINGYTTSSVVNVSFTKGTDTGSGLAASSGLLQRSAATLSGGSCGTFDAFATIAANPTSVYFNTVTTGCYQYRYLISDNVGNQATYTSASVVKVDQIPPTNTISIANVTGGAYSAFNGAVLYFKGDVAGSFNYIDGVADGESGPAAATFPAIATTGWTHDNETVSTPSGGPYTSSPYSWSPNPGTPPLQSLVGKDVAGKIWSAAITFVSDVTPPAGTSVSYTNGVVNAASVPVSLNNGGDGGSGVDPATAVLRRDTAPLNTTTETCSTFPGTFPTTVALVGGADATVSSGNCYRYQYTLADHVGNSITASSGGVAKVDTSGPRVTAITAQQVNGTPGTGQLQVGDKLLITFNQSLTNATVPTSFSGAAETSPGALQNVTLTIPGITSGAVDTGSAGYILLGSATFNGNISLSNNGTSTLVTVAVTSVSGLPLASSGALAFKPAATITDGGGNAAAGTFITAGSFKLF